MRMHTMRFEKLLLTCLLTMVCLSVQSQQNIGVSSFRLLNNDLTANTEGTIEYDQNGDKAALIKIVTTQTGFEFDCGSLGIVKSAQKTGEIWLYVPRGVKRVTIKHPQLGVLRDYEFGVPIEGARTYEMVLTTGQVQTIVKQDLGGSYLVLTVSPSNAIVVIDDVEQPVDGGVVSKFLSYGTHTYKVSAPLYRTEDGIIEMGGGKKTLEINLKPTYGQLEISTTPENGAKVYIDNSETAAGTTPFTTAKLAGGSHTLLLQQSQYESRTMTVDVPSDGTTRKLSVPMTANFGTLTVTAPQGCHIYVNNDDKGTSPWTGKLSAGAYVVEARRESHRSTSKRVEVSKGGKHEVTLDAPTPIYGSLNVTSKPVGADVYVDGTKVGTAPDIFNNVLEGTRTVELKKSGYAVYSSKVTVSEGKVSDLAATLTTQEAPKAVVQTGQGRTVKGNTGNAVIDGLINNMVFVEGGTFTMGATAEQGSDIFSEEIPIHRVTLSSFMIGKYEVTQAQWKAVMGKNPSKFSGDNHPVEQVSWKDCQSFIRKLNKMTGMTFRLPTEAEWEYAARGGNKSKGYKYSGSNNIDDVAWYNGILTHAVGTKQPNELGLYDMSGNVWEWCSDWYGSYSSSSQANPTGAKSGSDRVLRSGSWVNRSGLCRVSCRLSYTPGYSDRTIGLRLVLQQP